MVSGKSTGLFPAYSFREGRSAGLQEVVALLRGRNASLRSKECYVEPVDSLPWPLLTPYVHTVSGVWLCLALC